jgi:hypothetical protein
MSATRDPTGISSIGIQSIMPTMRKLRRVFKREREDSFDTEDAPSKSDHEASSSHAPGIGGLLDKKI